MSSTKKEQFGTTADGQGVDLFTLTNSSAASVQISNFGGVIIRLLVPDKSGKLGDVALGFDNLQQYEQAGPYFGAIIGRFCNRIAHGTFTIDGNTYHIPKNNGPHSLHGGTRGYSHRVWSADMKQGAESSSLELTLVDPDGEQGFPGTVRVTTVYTWTNDNTLRVQFSAITDKATPINLTNHSYFNLKDGGRSKINDHVLKLYANNYLPVDDTLVPTGKTAPVKNTPIDFTSPKPIGRDLLAMGGMPPGYDHCLVLNNQTDALTLAAEVHESETGRLLHILTTQPGMQFYTGNFLDGKVRGKDGVFYPQHSAFALETQHYPDSPNQPTFPSTTLRPGQAYQQVTEFRFSVR